MDIPQRLKKKKSLKKCEPSLGGDHGGSHLLPCPYFWGICTASGLYFLRKNKGGLCRVQVPSQHCSPHRLQLVRRGHRDLALRVLEHDEVEP